MRTDRFTIVLDANVIAGALPRNILLSFAEAGFFRPRWSKQILDEFHGYFVKRYGDEETADRQRQNMMAAFPEALVEGHEVLIDALKLPDEDDRHVLACAIKTKASVIVTDNLKDFPNDALIEYEIEAISLDDFVADTLDLGGAEAIYVIKKMRQRFANPELTAEELILRIEKCGMVETSKILAEYSELI
ncbi:putative ribonuclease VapC50 (plasmid) [Maritalea myrionectae]|uniref:Putative ribonuclease VapC50 n=1 Tax=Maritalea myrionectae TaxID=454601 RepID=A0A2R4MIX3_9HYPH|nr:PIN domain-containing protein [Maritalea myrionectae]AVX05968.1 putative ribonuclease VapC50 [Maritalea myrionectae]